MKNLHGLNMALNCLIIGLFLILPIATANNYCIDNNTKGSNITVQGSNYIWIEDCNYGCDNTFNTCLPSPFVLFLVVMFSIGGIILFFWIILKGVFKI
jgi:hypothetical protein